jgi:hypothetical protein
MVQDFGAGSTFSKSEAERIVQQVNTTTNTNGLAVLLTCSCFVCELACRTRQHRTLRLTAMCHHSVSIAQAWTGEQRLCCSPQKKAAAVAPSLHHCTVYAQLHVHARVHAHALCLWIDGAQILSTWGESSEWWQRGSKIYGKHFELTLTELVVQRWFSQVGHLLTFKVGLRCCSVTCVIDVSAYTCHLCV